MSQDNNEAAQVAPPGAQEANNALTALKDRLELIYRLCCGLAPKQSVGELVDVMCKMPEWGVVRAAITAPVPATTQAEQPQGAANTNKGGA